MRNVQLAALGVQRIKPGLGSGNVRKVRVNGNPLHAVIGNHALNFAHRVHFFVRVNAPEPHKLVGISPAKLQHAVVVGRKSVSGFAVTTGYDPKLHTKIVQISHNLVKRLGLAGVKANGFAGRLEHGAVLDAVNDFWRVWAKAKVNNVHNAVLLNPLGGLCGAGGKCVCQIHAGCPIRLPAQETKRFPISLLQALLFLSRSGRLQPTRLVIFFVLHDVCQITKPDFQQSLT